MDGQCTDTHINIRLMDECRALNYQFISCVWLNVCVCVCVVFCAEVWRLQEMTNQNIHHINISQFEWTTMDYLRYYLVGMLPSPTDSVRLVHFSTSSMNDRAAGVAEAEETKWCNVVTIAIIIYFNDWVGGWSDKNYDFDLFFFFCFILMNAYACHNIMICGQHVNYTVTAFGAPSALFERKTFTLNNCAWIPFDRTLTTSQLTSCTRKLHEKRDFIA